MSLSPEPCPFSSLCRLALLGVCDCCESCSELLDRSLKRTNELSEKVVLGRNLGKSHYTRGVEYLAADVSSLELEVLVILSVLAKDSCGCRLIVGYRDSGGSVEHAGKSLVAGFVHGELEKGVLLYEVSYSGPL